jgi:hypothetical protein
VRLLYASLRGHKKGYNLKNIGSRVVGLVGNDNLDGEYIFQVSM